MYLRDQIKWEMDISKDVQETAKVCFHAFSLSEYTTSAKIELGNMIIKVII